MSRSLRVAYLRRFADAEIIAALEATPGIDLVVLTAAEAEAGGLQGCEGMVSAGAKDLWTPALGAAVTAAGLRFIQNVTAGYDGIDQFDLPGVAIYGNGGALGGPVAEHGMAMLLTLTRCLHHAVRAADKARWLRQEIGRPITLQGKVMTVLGFGSIGREAARRAAAFGMEIHSLRRTAAEDPLCTKSFGYDQIAEALALSDVLFLAAPLTPETLRIVRAETLAQIKPGAIIVNVGRGDLICTEALIAALESGRLGGACLDVTAPEPLPDDHPLWHAPNVVISPHIAGASDRSGAEIARNVARHLSALVRGETPGHIIRQG